MEKQAQNVKALQANPLKIKTAKQRTDEAPARYPLGVTAGVSFDGVHSFRDWGLYLKERPTVSPPEPKTTYVSVPYRDGDIDISTALTDGEVRYKNRELKFSFATFDNVPYWSTIYSKIQNYLHGKDMKIIIDNDPEFYYIGRASVEPMTSDDYRGYLEITVNAEPYKKDVVGSLDDWLWDPFNFYTGVIVSWGNMQISGTRTIEIEGDRQIVVPIIKVLSGVITVQVKWKDETNTKTLTTGTHEIYELRIREGSNIMKLSGTGTVSIDYRARSL